MNAYVTAIDTETNKMIWRSAPLVSNVESFTILGDKLITGYGFTAEPDFIYGLDIRTGEIVQRTDVRSAPIFLTSTGRTVFVRAYDVDYTLRVG